MNAITFYPQITQITSIEISVICAGLTLQCVPPRLVSAAQTDPQMPHSGREVGGKRS